jgi:hypothetical protein
MQMSRKKAIFVLSVVGATAIGFAMGVAVYAAAISSANAPETTASFTYADNPFQMDSQYTASFRNTMLNAQGEPNGYTYDGKVSVDRRNKKMAYRMTMDSPNTGKVISLLVDGIAYMSVPALANETAGTSGYHCIGPHSTLDLTAITNAELADVAQKHDKPAPGCAGDEWVLQALDTEYVMCVVGGIPTRIRGEFFVLDITNFDAGTFEPFEHPDVIHSGKCEPGEPEPLALSKPNSTDADAWWKSEGRRRLGPPTTGRFASCTAWAKRALSRWWTRSTST